jgi:hypothetical protein
VKESLLLDEMHASIVAAQLRERGHDVIAVVDDVELRGMSDEEILVWAGQNRRRIVTENVKDFRPMLLRPGESGGNATAVLFTSSRTFPRTRRHVGKLIEALEAWLCQRGPHSVEDWLRPVTHASKRP